MLSAGAQPGGYVACIECDLLPYSITSIRTCGSDNQSIIYYYRNISATSMILLRKTYQEGNKILNLQFTVRRPPTSYSWTSEKIAMAGGMIVCQFQVDAQHKWSLFEMFEKVDDCDFMQYKITSKCFFCEKEEPIFDDDDEPSKLKKIADDSITLITTTLWHKKGTFDGDKNCKTFDINFLITIDEIILNISPFKSLHDDTTLTDFELCAVDGSIDTHKLVLAASSPMFNTMLSGEWKDTVKGKVDLAGVTKETLIDLKNYIYLRVLPKKPDDESENDQTFPRLVALLKLAVYLMMSDLIQACTAHLLLHLTSENAWELLHLSGMYKLTNLMSGILSSWRHEENLIKHRQSPDDWI